MDVGRIFSRSIELIWKFKFLWLFGFVMALTGGGLGGNANFRGTTGFNNPSLNQAPQIQPAVIGFAVIVGLVFFLVWLVLFFYFRFVSRGALVSSVRDIEGQGTATLRGAWDEGRRFYSRLLGLGFLVNVPLVLFTILVIIVAFIPLIGLIASSGGQFNDTTGRALATLGITGILAICCGILCVVLVSLVVHPLYEFAVRAIVLEDLHVMDGIRRGIQQARENLGNVIVVYLILIGARLGWGVATAILFIPIGLV
ncbi:MAG TPA: hypothetical protein VFD70_15935, partial [Anaerolineae bacterium]|nr:hypothetical protein [Anaerolineae bacterium]